VTAPEMVPVVSELLRQLAAKKERRLTSENGHNVVE